MSTSIRFTRWTPIRRARRVVERWRSARRPRWRAGSAWAFVLDLAGEDAPCQPVCTSVAKNRTSRSPRLPPASGDFADQQAAPAFVELLPALPAVPAECTLELTDPSGRRLSVSLRGAPGPDLVALAQSLWRSGR